MQYNYNDEEVDEERPEPIQLLQPQRTRISGASARPQHIPVPDEVTIRQRPRITINTTPAPLYQIQTQTAGNSVSITPRPAAHREVQTQPPATTYRPTIQYFTQKAAPVTYTKHSQLAVEPITKTSYTSTRKPLVDFAAEFQKFQQENNVVTTTTPRVVPSKLKTYRPQKLELPSPTPNPIYETQLVFDPATGQIDSSLFPQLPQPNVAYRIQSSFAPQQQSQFQPSPQIVSLEQLQQQQQNAQPIYQRPLQVNYRHESHLKF